MGYSKIEELLGDNSKVKALIANLSSNEIGSPYIVQEVLKLLEDNSVLGGRISDSNKVHLAMMLSQYFSSCYFEFVEDRQLDKLLEYGKIEVYKIEASRGLRYATVNEIAQGVKGLIGENIYPAGEKEYKLLSLLQWTYTGRSYYYRQAGYQLQYNKNGEVITDIFTMIQNSANEMVELFKWVKMSEQYEKAIAQIEKMKKHKGYKYATFEKDEVSEDITIKQLIFNIRRVFPRNSSDVEYRRALALAIKGDKIEKEKAENRGRSRERDLTPLEISFMRGVYDRYIVEANGSRVAETNEQLKQECETLLANRYSGKINQDDFVFKIIDTLKKGRYSRCSTKQYDIVKSALDKLQKSNEKPMSKAEVLTEDFIDTSLEYMSDTLGAGLFEDEQEEIKEAKAIDRTDGTDRTNRTNRTDRTNGTDEIDGTDGIDEDIFGASLGYMSDAIGAGLFE